MMANRRPFLTAKRLLSNQTFRDLYRTDTLDVDQRLKITSLTFLFTDLSGSTELYERVGDLVAFDLVRAHFNVLNEIVAAEAGAVVKTIGDAVMATFPTPDRAVAAALRMRDAMRKLNEGRGQRGPAPEDRHPRRPLHRRDAERAAGLFRADRQHRLARPGPRHRRARSSPPERRGRRRARIGRARGRRPDADVAERDAQRDHQRGSRLRDTVSRLRADAAYPGRLTLAVSEEPVSGLSRRVASAPLDLISHGVTPIYVSGISSSPQV